MKVRPADLESATEREAILAFLDWASATACRLCEAEPAPPEARPGVVGRAVPLPAPAAIRENA